MPYIAILQDKNHSDRELEAYRYGGIGVTETDTPAFTPGTRIRVWTAETMREAQNQADRLSSGLFGARVCETDIDLTNTLEEWR